MIRIEDVNSEVQRLLYKHNMSVDTLSSHINYATSTIYEYTGGRHPNQYLIWLKILQGLFELTQDPACLLTGNVPVMMVPLPEFKNPAGGLQISQLSELIKANAGCVDILARLIGNKIGPRDRESILKFDDLVTEVITLLVQCKCQVVSEYEKNTNRELL
ncbi:MAG: hypothetical protein JXA04_01395 [Gammaproteobacteria bacterium]|nr:hypothetical protein [Gammaproteobacteria bacterium]